MEANCLQSVAGKWAMRRWNVLLNHALGESSVLSSVTENRASPDMRTACMRLPSALSQLRQYPASLQSPWPHPP